MKFCTACGAPVTGYGKFCGECGAQIAPPSTPPYLAAIDTQTVAPPQPQVANARSTPEKARGGEDFNSNDHVWDGNKWWTLDRSYYWDGDAWRRVGWAPPNARAIPKREEEVGSAWAPPNARAIPLREQRATVGGAPATSHVAGIGRQAESISANTAWHRNGNTALVMASLPLASYIFVLLGAPLPPASGWFAIIGAILGWRARDTPTRVQGNWAIAIAALTLALVVGSIAIAAGAPK
jgi:hypothetical protein